MSARSQCSDFSLCLCLFVFLTLFSLTHARQLVPIQTGHRSPSFSKRRSPIATEAQRTKLQTLTRASETGYSYDSCKTDSDCIGKRTCVAKVNKVEESCKADSPFCACAPHILRRCSTSADCEANEGCTRDTQGKQLCVSRAFISESGWPLLASPTTPPRSAPGSPPPRICRDGLTSDPCETFIDCKGSRTCPFGFCVMYKSCALSSDCVCGESCVIGLFRERTCHSTLAINKHDILPVEAVGQRPAVTTTPTSTPVSEKSNVCIGIESLQHYSRDELVFREHQLANVLCDKHRSCATPGHMVQYNGSVMMMQTYCAMVGCERGIMHVNSPRWRRALRVPSQTTGLQFTALAARYETQTEEVLLSAIAHLRL